MLVSVLPRDRAWRHRRKARGGLVTIAAIVLVALCVVGVMTA